MSRLDFRLLCSNGVLVNKIPLEDNFSDVLGKAQRGIQLSDEQLAQKAGVSDVEVTRVKEGQFDETVVRKLAAVLSLKPDALAALGKKSWYPKNFGEVPGLAAFTTSYGDMTVNSYLIWDPKTNQGAAFDTGADCSGMTKFAVEKGIKIQMILLTHTHSDHVADLARLRSVTQAAAFVSKLEAIDGAETFEVSRKFTVGPLKIDTRQTSGHSHGGVTYVIAGLSNRVAIVGDSIFAGSMGGGLVSYSDALRNNREQILTLPEDTILCPGHGPLTTVGEEKQHNPFFP